MYQKLEPNLMVVVLLSFLWAGVWAGDCYRLDTGVVLANAVMLAHPEQIKAVGSYLYPVVGNCPTDTTKFRSISLLNGIPISIDWTLLNDNVDRAVLDEEDYSGTLSWSTYLQQEMYWRQTFMGIGTIVASFDSPFYRSPYYLCESAYTDAALVSAIQRGKSDTTGWKLIYIGNVFGRPPVDSATWGLR